MLEKLIIGTVVIFFIVFTVIIGIAMVKTLEEIEQKGLKNIIMPVVEEIWEGENEE